MKISKFDTHFVNKKPKLIEERYLDYDCYDKLDTDEKIVDMLRDEFYFHKLTEEHVFMMCMNPHMDLIGIFDVSHGTISNTILPVREMFMKALLAGATGIIVAHNHPSGLCLPSKLDLKTAEGLQAAATLLGLHLIDFLIVTENELYSFRQNHLIGGEMAYAGVQFT